jgi:hypothetical protein
MSWWKRLFGGSRPEKPRLLASHELGPDRLSAHVYLQDVRTPEGVISCWTYFTVRGNRPGEEAEELNEWKDLVFTLRRRPDEKPEAFPGDPFLFFLVRDRLNGGFGEFRDAEVGSYITCPPGFLGATRRKGLAYVEAQPFPGMSLPQGALAAVLLTPEEWAVVRQAGTYRVLALLGKAAPGSPLPTWSDQDRLSAITSKDMEGSVLASYPAVRGVGAVACLTGGRDGERGLLVEFAPHVCDELRCLLVASKGPVAVPTQPAPRAQRLYWEPAGAAPRLVELGQQASTSVTGGFVAFRPTSDGAEGAGVLEDGFVVELTDASRAGIEQALRQGETFTVQGGPGRWGVTLRFGKKPPCVNPRATGSCTTEFFFMAPPSLEKAIASPVAELPDRALGDWQSYGPPDWMPEIIEWPVRWVVNFWLVPLPELEVRVDRESFPKWVQALGQTVKEHVARLPSAGGCNLDLTWAVWPGGAVRFWVRLSPDRGEARMSRGLRQRLYRITPPRVRRPVVCSSAFLLWGGGGVNQPLLTNAWLRDLQGLGGAVDEILGALRPM